MMDTEEKSEVAAHAVAGEEEDWCIPCSDDEETEGDSKKIWEPEPKKIIELYDKLCKDKVIELEWKNPGRRPPESEQESKDVDESLELPEEEEKEEEVTEFDFSSIPEPTITPRRTPASAKTPRTHRVARMDKILDDIFKKKMDSISKSDNNNPKSPRVVPGPASAGPSGDTTPKRPNISGEIQKDPFSAS